MNRFLTAVLIVCVWLLPAAADDYPRNPNIDVVHYVFRLEVTDANNVISGTAGITVLFKTAGITDFHIDLIGLNRDSGTGMAVRAVSSPAGPLQFDHTGGRIRIHLAQPSKKNERRTFTVGYSGIPADGLIISENKYGERTFFGDNWPDRAHNWLPTVDHPSDKSTCEFIITAPEQYQVVAVGRKVEETNLPGGKRLTHWKESVPIATYCMVTGIARFAVQYLETGAVPIQSWIYPQDRDAGFYDYAIAERVVDFYSSHIGPFSYEKLANVQSKTRYGGMENSSAIFYSERSVRGNRGSEGLFAHEIAHQWFGDSVTEADWHHIWLSEGFATYFTHVYNEYLHGRDTMVRGLQRDRQRVIAYYERAPESPVVDTSITNLNRLLSTNSYQKGSWVLHMLRRELGDDTFWEGIRTYYRTYRNGTALTSDLRGVMETVSGKDLEQFFDQWIFQPGQPSIAGSWSYASGVVTVDISQAQTDGTFFSVPLDIGIYPPGGDRPRIETVRLDGRQQTFTFESDEAPERVVLDPDTWLLMQSDFAKK